MEKMTNVKAIAYAIENGNFPAEVVEKLEKIKASYENKSGNRKPTKTQVENEKVKADILNVLTDEGQTATQICEAIKGDYEEMSLAKVTALLTQLYDKGNGVIDRYTEKRKAYFRAKGV